MPMAGTMATDHYSSDVKAELKAKGLLHPGRGAERALDADEQPRRGGLVQVAGRAEGQHRPAPHGAVLEHERRAQHDRVRGAVGGLQPLPEHARRVRGTIDFQIPMEAKLGLRFHLPRKDVETQPGWASVPGRKVRDPLSQDVFDVEVDFTWANDSALQNINLNFVTNPSIPIEPNSLGKVPANGNIPHLWKDVVGVRVGGDVAVVPNRLSLRTGGWFETKGQDDSTLNLDFDLAQKLGLSGGATVRVGPVDLSVGYQHTFWWTLNNNGQGQVYALSGDASGTTDGACGSNPISNPKIGQGCFRSWQPVNGGSLTEHLNEFGFSATARF